MVASALFEVEDEILCRLYPDAAIEFLWNLDVQMTVYSQVELETSLL